MAAAAGGSGVEGSASCAAALRGALGQFMVHGPAATRSALDSGAADLFGEAISRHPTLAAAALLPDLPALASGAKTAFLRAEAFRLLAAKAAKKKRSRDAVATTREAAIAAVAAQRATAGSAAGGEAAAKKAKTSSQAEGQASGYESYGNGKALPQKLNSLSGAQGE